MAAVTRCRPPSGSRSRCGAAGCAPTGRSWSTTTGRGSQRRGPGGCCATTATPTSGCSTAAGPPGATPGTPWRRGSPRRCRATSSPTRGGCRSRRRRAARVAAEGVLLDARAPERFSGEPSPRPGARPRPGAVSLPATAEPPRRSVPPARRSSRSSTRAPTARGRRGAYCGSGVTATHDLFALHLLGREGALYPGSWSGWVSDPASPVRRSRKLDAPEPVTAAD